MYPVSAAWSASLASSAVQLHLEVEATVLANGIPVLGPVDVEQVTVTVDRNQAQRSSLTATFTGLNGSESIIPTDITSPFAPNGNELALSAGFTYPDGTVELIPVGVFPIQTVTVTDTGTDLTVAVTASDRSWSISRRALINPYSVTAGETVDQAILALLTSNTSGLPLFHYAITTTTAPAAVSVYNHGSDPWQAALDLATGAGFELFFDRFGNVNSRPIPDPNTIAVSWAASATSEGAGPLAIARTLTASHVSNDWIVAASNTSTIPPIQAEASDTNPSSPTWVGGKFGDIPSFITSSTAASLGGAQAAANAELTASLGQVDTMVLTVVPNPAIDVDDIFTVTRDRAGLDGTILWVVDGYTMALQVGGTMTVNLRRVI